LIPLAVPAENSGIDGNDRATGCCRGDRTRSEVSDRVRRRDAIGVSPCCDGAHEYDGRRYARENPAVETSHSVRPSLAVTVSIGRIGIAPNGVE
jgi:hypothetical protein